MAGEAGACGQQTVYAVENRQPAAAFIRRRRWPAGCVPRPICAVSVYG
nr:MAG TPA: hypothetical protein [Caudoviricetes sp.]